MFLMTKNRKFYNRIPEFSKNCKTFKIPENLSAALKIEHPALQTKKSSLFSFFVINFSFSRSGSTDQNPVRDLTGVYILENTPPPPPGGGGE
jgi:hypothetical protein